MQKLFNAIDLFLNWSLPGRILFPPSSLLFFVRKKWFEIPHSVSLKFAYRGFKRCLLNPVWKSPSFVLHHVHGEGRYCAGHHYQIHAIPHFSKIRSWMQDKSIIENLKKNSVVIWSLTSINFVIFIDNCKTLESVTTL